MNAKENKQNQIKRMNDLLEQAHHISPEKLAKYLVDHGAEVRENATWILDETYEGKNRVIYVCSHCLHWQGVAKFQREQTMYMKYCPFCGARMMVEQKEIVQTNAGKGEE